MTHLTPFSPEAALKRSSLARLVLSAAVAAFATTALADFRFVHTSDTHFSADGGPSSHAATNRELWKEMSELTPAPAFTVCTGDIVEAGWDPEYEQFNKSIKEALKCPHYESTGNHDIRWNPLGKEGFVKGTGQPLWQSWDHENVHFVVLDSTVLLQHWGHFDQKQLDWLKADLEKVGTEKPVVIGFHHWIGREKVQVDNEQQLMDLVKPYNVRLWLQGHGHSQIEWNINGVPAIMQTGLYQGGYTTIDVTKDEFILKRRSWGKPKEKEILQGDKSAVRQPVEWRDLMRIPLAKPVAPKWDAKVTSDGKVANIRIETGDLPAETKFTYRFDQTEPKPVTEQKQGGTVSLAPAVDTLSAGRHFVTVQADLPDGRSYQLPVEMKLDRPGTPNPAWTANVGGAVLSRLVRDGESLFITTMGGNLAALDPATGKPRWTFPTGDSVFSTPELRDGTAYFGSADHFVYAVDAATGKQKWKFKAKAGVLAGPACAQNVVAVTSTDKTIYGLDAATGDVKWTLPVQGMYQSKAATDGTHFYLGGWDNTLRCIEAATGKEVWNIKVGRNAKGIMSFALSPAISSPAVADGKVFVTSNDGVLHAVNTADGKILWEVDRKNLGYSSPLYHDGLVYCAISNGGNVFAADAKTGKIVWENKTGSDIYDSSFTHSAGHVFIGNVDGTFSALDAKTGKIAWQYQLGPGHVLASPAADPSQVYIANMAGNVFAFPTTPTGVAAR
jgi:outer membrane protein assembly factor BamB